MKNWMFKTGLAGLVLFAHLSLAGISIPGLGLTVSLFQRATCATQLTAPTERELEALMEETFPRWDLKKTFKKLRFITPTDLMFSVLLEHTRNPEDGFMIYDFFGELRQRITPSVAYSIPLLKAVMGVHDAHSPHTQKYFEELGRWGARNKPIEKKNRRMPPPPDVEGEYWDMASGGLIDSQFKYLEKNRKYRFFDISPVVVGFLKEQASIHGIDAEVVETDIRTIQKPRQKIAVIRCKNAAAYAEGFENHLVDMAQWIVPGGQLIIQSEPPKMCRIAFEKAMAAHGPHLIELILDGWDFKYDLKGKYHFDTITLTRPVGKPKARSEKEVVRIWTDFISRAEARLN